MRVDAIVVGLGSMGSAAAQHLAARGLRVIGFDQFAPPHGRGAHSGGSRIIRTAYMEGPDYVPLVRRAQTLWGQLEAATGETLVSVTGALMLGPPESLAVAGALATARAQGLPHELLDAAEIRRRFPAFTPSEDEVGLFEAEAGLIRPERAIRAQLAMALAHGADLRTGEAVRSWTATPAGVSVVTERGTAVADRLILAPGAWAPRLLQLSVPMRVERRVQHYWRPADPAPFQPGRLPVWIWDWGPDQTGYGLPAVDNGDAIFDPGSTGGPGEGGVGIKAALHRGSEAVDPDTGATPARPDEVATMREWLRTRVPLLAGGDWLGATPCLYTLTPDEHFVLGAHPSAPNVWVAGGFSGHGFKFAPVVGEILADLAITGSTAHPIRIFHPARTFEGESG